MTYNTLDLHIQSHVAWLTLNRPQALNALSLELLDELSQAIDELASAGPQQVRVLVVTGRGRAFCAGADLQSVAQANASAGPPFLDIIQAVLRKLRRMPMPTIAAVNGIAMGGGLELAMHCDIIVASETAKLADAHANVGVLPGAGGASLLPRLVGASFAKYMVFSGESVTATELHRLGLIAKLFPQDELEAGARALASRIADKSPLALARMKQLIDDGLEQASLDTALAMERTANALHAHSHDYAEGLAAFHDKRAPQFIGR